MKKINLLLILAFVAVFFSCKKDHETPNTSYSDGAFILNEGAMFAGNASVSFLRFSGDSVSNQIFQNANGRPVGDVLQSMNLIGDQAYLIVNNSNKIEIVKTSDFSQQGVIENLKLPRFMAVKGNYGYLTQWDDSSVGILNLSTRSLEKSVKVGSGPEGILIHGNYAFVANSGGFDHDSTVSVIDLTTQSVVKTIEVGGMPKKFVVDKNNMVWVLCSGDVFYTPDWSAVLRETPSKLVQLSPGNLTILKEITLSSNEHFSSLDISPDKQTIYYGCGYSVSGIYALSVDAASAGTLKVSGMFNGFSVCPKNGEIYALEAPSYTAAGNLKRYSADGQHLKTYKVGIGPNAAVFVE